MGLTHSPKIVTDGLSFIYDTGSGKSYKGEPTTNLLNYTTEFNNWTAAKNSGTTPTVTADTSVNPLGLVGAPMADRVYLPDDGTYPRIQQYFTPASTNTHTFSVWIRSISGNCDCFLGAFRNSPWSLPGSSVKSITGEWQRFTFSWTPPDTTTHVIYMGSHDTAAQRGNTLEFWGAQMEAKSHATQFVNGTRSTTQGLLDLTKNETITLSNMSYDSNAQMTFDGTDDYFEISDPNVSSLDGFSVELIIKPDNPTSSPAVIVPNSGGIDHWLRFDGNGRLYIRMIPAANSGGQNFKTSTQLSSGNYHHVVFTFKQSEGGKAYYNGALETSAAATLTALDWSSIWRIGQRGNNTMFFEGELPVLKVYNRTLTAAEVLQNYNALKSRFL